MSRIVYLNGAFVDEADARVSIFDRGYLFGDGVYEVVPVCAGRLIDQAPFIARLDRSLRELEIAWPCAPDDYVAFHNELIRRNDLVEGMVYSQVTRGVADRDFAFPKGIAPAVIAFTQRKAIIANPLAETGVKVVTVEDIRWQRRDIKSIALLGQVLSKQQAAEQGAFEGWMVEDGMVTEGTSSTAYIVKDGVIVTRPLSRAILPGIRRRVLLELGPRHGLAVDERPFSVAEALAADEAMLTSASNFVLPVVAIDGQPVGTGKPGPVARRLREIYIAAALAEAGVRQ
ncbi:MAG: D-amino-acid transaminase [Aestuariivirgaceae bacterium]